MLSTTLAAYNLLVVLSLILYTLPKAPLPIASTISYLEVKPCGKSDRDILEKGGENRIQKIVRNGFNVLLF